MISIRRSDRVRALLSSLDFHDPEAVATSATLATDEILEVERRLVLSRHWHLAGHVSQLGSPGDFCASMAGSESVVALRGRDGRLRGLSNVCTHRASLLVDGAGNCGRNLVCSYHGWIFGHDGQLRGVPYRNGFETLDTGVLGLPEFTVDQLGPFVFIDPSCSDRPLTEGIDVPPVFNEDRWRHEGVVEVESSWKDLVIADLTDPSVDRAMVVFPTFVAAHRHDEWIARRFEPVAARLTRVHTHRLSGVAAPQSVDEGGISGQAAHEYWTTRYAGAVAQLLGSSS